MADLLKQAKWEPLWNIYCPKCYAVTTLDETGREYCPLCRAKEEAFQGLERRTVPVPRKVVRKTAPRPRQAHPKLGIAILTFVILGAIGGCLNHQQDNYLNIPAYTPTTECQASCGYTLDTNGNKIWDNQP